MAKVTIRHVDYDVPQEVADYILDKQAGERRAAKLGMQRVPMGMFEKALRFIDLPKKQQLAVGLQAMLEHSKGTHALMEVVNEIAKEAVEEKRAAEAEKGKE